MSGPATPRPSRPPRGRAAQHTAAASPVTRLQRRAATAAVAPAEREHATEVVAHLLHRECGQWSWTAHTAGAHRAEASEIVGALCREGWGPHRSAA